MSEFSLKEAGNAAKTLSKLFRNMEKIGSVLERIGDIEAYSKEADQLAVTSKNALATANVDLSLAHEQLDQAKAALVLIATDADSNMRAAKANVANTIAKAEQDVVELRAKAEAAASVSRDIQSKEKEVLDAEISELTFTRDGLAQQVADLRNELAAMIARLGS